jgi:hypothetical protein
MSHTAVGFTVGKESAMQTTRARRLWLVGICSALLAGCAGTPPAPKFSHSMVSDSRVAAPDTAEVTIELAEHIEVLPSDRDRVTQKIKARIDARKLTNAASTEPRSFQVVLRVTRYEKGNRFARAMLAGLGQIHLEGTISVYQMPGHTLLEEFDMQKTFAWGGVYGASTSMEEIEDTFADGVAATVTGQDHPVPKAKS